MRARPPCSDRDRTSTRPLPASLSSDGPGSGKCSPFDTGLCASPATTGLIRHASPYRRGVAKPDLNCDESMSDGAAKEHTDFTSDCSSDPSSPFRFCLVRQLPVPAGPDPVGSALVSPLRPVVPQTWTSCSPIVASTSIASASTDGCNASSHWILRLRGRARRSVGQPSAASIWPLSIAATNAA